MAASSPVERAQDRSKRARELSDERRARFEQRLIDVEVRRSKSLMIIARLAERQDRMGINDQA
jgi:hypothetical protein